MNTAFTVKQEIKVIPTPSMFRVRHPLFAFIGWLTIVFVSAWVVWKFFLTI